MEDGLCMYHCICSSEMNGFSTAAGVPYNVSIAAVNRAGLGEITVLIHFTRELPPSIAPMNVTLSRPSPTVMVALNIELMVVSS